MRYALATDVGSLRENNEDRARALPEQGIFVVADGMGGHIAGEIASQVAVDGFVEAVTRQKRPRRIRDEVPLLAEAAQAANTAVVEAAESQGLIGMGTTLTGVIIRGRTVTLAHVGDSRAYLANRKIRLLTRDHTMAALLVHSGVLSEAEAMQHPDRHVLTQAVGTARHIEPDAFQVRMPRATQLLLCTDGLYDVVPEEEIRKLVRSGDLEHGARALIEAANANGGPDNITVILVEL